MKKDPSNQTDQTDLTDFQRWALYAPWLEATNPATRANATIYLLDHQTAALEEP